MDWRSHIEARKSVTSLQNGPLSLCNHQTTYSASTHRKPLGDPHESKEPARKKQCLDSDTSRG